MSGIPAAESIESGPAVPTVETATTPALIGDSLAHGMTVALLMTVFQRLIGLGRGFLFCGVLDDDQVGLWSLTQSLIFSLAPLAVLGTTSSLRRYVEHFRVREQLGGFLRITLGSAALLAIVAAAILAVGSGSWARLLFRDPAQADLVLIVAVCLVAIVVFNTLQDLTESLRLLRAASWMRMIHSAGFTLLGAIFVLAISADVIWVSIAFLIATLLACLPAWTALRSLRGKGVMGSLPVLQQDVWKRIGRYALWNCLISFISNVFELSDRYMLLVLGGEPEVAQGLVGQYHTSRMIPVLMLGVAMMVSNLLLPYLVTHWERRETVEVKRLLELALKGMAIAGTFGSAAVIALAPLTFGFLFQGRYDASVGILPMTLVYCLWFSLYTIGEDYLWCCEKGGWATGGLALAVLANFGLNALLIPTWGLEGATFATLLANGLAWASLLLMGRRFGWSASPSLLIISAFPLVLLLGAIPALVSCIALLVVLKQGGLIDEYERRTIEGLFAKLMTRLGRSNGSAA